MANQILKTQTLLKITNGTKLEYKPIIDKLELEMKSAIQPIEDRLDKFVGFRESVNKQLLLVFKEIDKLKEMFKKFELENQPLIKELPVFLESEKKTF